MLKHGQCGFTTLCHMAFVEKPGPLIISACHMHLLECGIFLSEFSCHMERVGFVSQHIRAFSATKNILSKNVNLFFIL